MSDRNQPAFPIASDIIGHCGGLTKREEFAKAAMGALIAYSGTYGTGNGPSEIASRAVECADALLKELGYE